MTGAPRSQPTTGDTELLQQKLEFAEFEWNRATEGMKQRDARIMELEGALKIARNMIRDEWIESAVIDTESMRSLGDVLNAALNPKAGS
jgi:hypothetical protein